MSGCGCGDCGCDCGCGKGTAASGVVVSDVIEIEPFADERDALTDADALSLAIAALDDPYLRWRAGSELTDPVIVIDDNVGWVWERHWDGSHEGWATVIGDDPAVAARIIDALRARRPFEGVTVRRRILDGLPEQLRPVGYGEWCPWTLDPSRVTWDRDPEVVDLDRADPSTAARIDALLAHSESAYIMSDDEDVTHWVGIERDGDLSAVAASHPEPSGAAHIVSVCTHPDVRGQRLAERVCRTLMRIARDEGVPMIYLEMYAHNEAGSRLYERIGMRQAPVFASGQLPAEA